MSHRTCRSRAASGLVETSLSLTLQVGNPLMASRLRVICLKELHLLGLENVEVEVLTCLKRSFAKLFGGP